MIAASTETPRHRRKRRRLDEILELTLEIVADKGPSGLTIRDLAAALDYTPGALYRYVSSKDELLMRVELVALERVAAAIRDSADRAPGPLEALVRAADTYLSLPEILPREATLLQFLLGDPRVLIDDAYARQVAPALASLLSDVAQLADRAVERGQLEPGDASRRALALWSAVQGASGLRKLRRLSPQLDAAAIALHTIEALLIGWGAEPAAVERAIAGVRS